MTKRDQSYRDQPMLFGDTADVAASPVAVVARSAVANRLTRATDPPTSGRAAERLIEQGKFAGDSADALALVRMHPGRTGYELDALDAGPFGKGYELNREGRIRKRLAGLADCLNPQIERGPARQCFEKKTKCQTWWPIGKAPPAPLAPLVPRLSPGNALS